MAKKMTLFNTLKINLSNIEQTESGLGVTTDFKTAKENGWVVALGDNQLLRFIRKLKDTELNQSLLDELYQERNQLKSTNSSKKNSKRILEIQSQIDELLFIPDILTVKVDTSQKDYKYLCKNGFFVNISINDKQYNIQYKRLCAGAGQLRRNSAMFVNVDLYDQLMKIMLCGLDKTSIGKINPAKFGAYFALFTSASRRVKTPRICVVNDYEYMLKDQMVDWIYELPNGEYDITQKNIDFKMNAFDGSGMICPEMAQVWQENLGLDYLPSSFIVRSPWVKGLCSVFDFRKFAKEIVHTDKIKDIYGVEYDVNEIDVILTKSQFKLWDKYSNWQKYMYYHKLFGHIFSVTRVNKKESDFATPLNYQYIQSNNFTDEQIKKLAEPTANWLNGILQFNPVDVSALMVGYHPECTVTEIEDKLDDPIAKCLLYNQEILKDQYVQKKISALAQKKIDQAKIGKILVEGSYDFLIPDLYAMAENAFGLEVKGLLPYKTMYSRRWVEKGAKCVSTQRSPLVASAENQVLNIYCDDKCREWFKYIEWGNIYNIWDLTIISQSDADFDGDISMTSDNKILVNSIDQTLPVITYDKQMTQKIKLNFDKLYLFDVKSFDSPIGGITNLASNLFAMKGNFSPDSQEYNEICRRIKLLRFYQGSAIDKTKGATYTPPPKHWNRRQKYVEITDDMSEEEIVKAKQQNEIIKFNNSICCDRKTYFFGYVYPVKLAELRQYNKEQKMLCKKNFNIDLNELKKKEDKTQDEKKFLRNLYKYMPLFNSNCTMNVLAKYIEDFEFNKNTVEQHFDYSVLMSDANREFNKTACEKIKIVLKQFEYQFALVTKHKRYLIEHCIKKETVEEFNQFDVLLENTKTELVKIISNEAELVDYLIYIYYNYYKSGNRTLIWQMFGDTVVSNVKNNSNQTYILKENEDGKDIFGRKFILECGDCND